MTRVLIVSCWYAPREHPTAVRWSAIAREWAASGVQVDVLCAENPGRASEEQIDGVRVVRVGRGLAAVAARGSRARRGIGSAAVAVWRAVRWPDWACLWYLPAAKKAKELLASATYDGLVSVSDPFTAHLVALAAHRMCPGVPWLVDIGDAFAPQEGRQANNQRLFHRLNLFAEERVLRAAPAVAVIAPSLRDRYAAAFPGLAAKITVVPLLYAPPPPGADIAVFPADGRLRLLWVGTLYRSIRNPGQLLELFRLLLAGPLGERIELHLMGDAGDCRDLVEAARRQSDGRLVAHGVVPRATALAATRQAGCLVNIGNVGAHQLPSKLAEYAASGRPILNLEGSSVDTSRAFLVGHPAVLSLPAAAATTPEGVARVERFLCQTAAPDPDRLASWLEPFTAPRVAAAYAALLARS